MQSRPARLTRGLVAAVFSTVVAAGSHTLAGGDAPGTLAFAVTLAFAAVTCVILTGKRLSLPRLAFAVGLSQFAFHGLFSALGGFAAPVIARSHHDMGTMSGLADASSHHTSALMWFAHGVAALLTVLALRFGESAFWSLRALAGRVIRKLVAFSPTALPAPGTRTPAAARLFAPRFFDLHSSALRYRGPPVSFVASATTH